jgi:hypothetical protein
MRACSVFTNGPRPPFNFPGAWLYSSGHSVLHLNDTSQSDRQQRTDSGVIRKEMMAQDLAAYMKGSRRPLRLLSTIRDQ